MDKKDARSLLYKAQEAIRKRAVQAVLDGIPFLGVIYTLQMNLAS